MKWIIMMWCHFGNQVKKRERSPLMVRKEVTEASEVLGKLLCNVREIANASAFIAATRAAQKITISTVQ